MALAYICMCLDNPNRITMIGAGVGAVMVVIAVLHIMGVS